MNREIKFRAFWKGVNKMKYFVPGNIEHLPEIGWALTFVQEGEDRSAYMGNAELMQFTGLKDKDGKEVYEGDVVCYPKGTGRWLIKYAANAFIGIPHSDNVVFDSINLDNRNYLQLEVIGNIHENPELLK